MSIYKLIITLFLLFVQISCSNNIKQKNEHTIAVESLQEDTCRTIDLEQMIDNTEKIYLDDKCNLSSISDSLSYIVLGSKNDQGKEAFVGRVLQTFVGEKYIILNCVMSVLLFDKSGKFIREIGRKGQGPGEYSVASFVDVNENSDRIYINNSGHKLQVYNFNGDFLQSTPFKDGNFFAVLDNNEYSLSYDNTQGDTPYHLIIQNEKADTIVSFVNNNQFERRKESYYVMSKTNQRFYRYKGDVYYRENYNDTIFKIENNELKPRYYLKLGKYHAPIEGRLEYQRSDEERRRISSQYYTVHVIESNKSLFMYYSTLYENTDRVTRIGYIYYEKETSICNYIKPSSVERFIAFNSTGFENDIDGGSIFLPEGATLDGESLFCTYNAANFKDKIEKAGYYDKIKYPEKQKALKKLIDSIDESTNVIIMLVTLK